MSEPAANGTAEPPALEPLHFVYDLPLISQRKLATIKLVARYTVLDPAQLQGRHFDFQDAGHSLHDLFQAFVHQYRLVQGGAEPRDGRVLHRAVRRAEHYLASKEAREAASAGRAGTEPGSTEAGSPAAAAATEDPGAAAAAARTELLSIDWQDFVVLETVEFFSADWSGASALSAPFTLADLQMQRQTDGRAGAEPLFKSAITGELVPASQYNEHIRIHTLDPSYRRQREKEAEREHSSNLDTSHVVENIERLRQKRRRLLDEQAD